MCSAKVDFPTPGLPPNKIRDPDKSPPPKTRSASRSPVGILSLESAIKTSLKDLVSRGLWSRPFFFADILNSESVPQSLQEGH